MPSLLITRGLPASGKTTYARAWVADAPACRSRVNRDDLRTNLFGLPFLDYAGEQTVTVAQQAAVRALLAAGRDVIVDDTNLRARYARAWADLAAEVGADFAVVDFPTPLDECLARDAARDRPVGEQVIRGMHDRYLTGGHGFAPVTQTARDTSTPAELYVPDRSLPPAWLVDVDGTLMLRDESPSGRSPFDWHRVGEDTPNLPVVHAVNALAAGAAIVVMSGRDEVCRAATEASLAPWIAFEALHMRACGDTRRDAIVKLELFREHVAPKWNVLGVIDDRNQVVRMWRSLGLTCLQCADGDF